LFGVWPEHFLKHPSPLPLTVQSHAVSMLGSRQALYRLILVQTCSLILQSSPTTRFAALEDSLLNNRLSQQAPLRRVKFVMADDRSSWQTLC